MFGFKIGCLMFVLSCLWKLLIICIVMGNNIMIIIRFMIVSKFIIGFVKKKIDVVLGVIVFRKMILRIMVCKLMIVIFDLVIIVKVFLLR